MYKVWYNLHVVHYIVQYNFHVINDVFHVSFTTLCVSMSVTLMCGRSFLFMEDNMYMLKEVY